MFHTTILLMDCVQCYLGAPQGPRFAFARERHHQGIRLLCLGITRNKSYTTAESLSIGLAMDIPVI